MVANVLLCTKMAYKKSESSQSRQVLICQGHSKYKQVIIRYSDDSGNGMSGIRIGDDLLRFSFWQEKLKYSLNKNLDSCHFSKALKALNIP